MVDSDTVVDQLKQLFERCATIEELPHSFDDTLLDGLIDNINLSARANDAESSGSGGGGQYEDEEAVFLLPKMIGLKAETVES
ncbi:hypothetical protein TELCIR_15678 [Teladorsagia circumcincta]|uniref:Uncharacterized protein n=1 Tax=Teladorsagia circumcincta TaxID=45464 RepID=A0A2G9TXH9_TELCI|nr:hypothetical protein TELCIR_15678 [Teladorsagia circumcincta]